MVCVVNFRYRVRPGVIPVCRPTAYGNPYKITVYDKDTAIALFAEFFYSEQGRKLREKALRDIPPDATIGCYCAPERCHADIIAGYLNWKRKHD